MKITMVNNQQGKKKNIMAKSNVLLHSSFIEREGGREKQIIKSQFLQLKKRQNKEIMGERSISRK
jgi:hypothetical protein